MIVKNPLRTAVRYRDGIPVLPGDFPLAGHTPMFFLDLLGALKEAKERVGPLFWTSGPAGRLTLLWTEKECLELLKNKTTTSAIPASSRVEGDDVVVGKSLLTIDGAPHHHARSAMNGPFLPRSLSASRVGATMAEMIEARVRGWARKQEISVLAETQELTLDIIFRIMGIATRDLSWWRAQYRDLLSNPLGIPTLLPGFPARRALQARQRLDARLLGIIEDIRRRGGASGEGDGLIAAMVHERDEAGQALSDSELLDNLRLLVLAGHETTAATMAWVAISLAGKPALWDELTAEAGKAPSIPTSPQGARDYPFAEALFREAVRFYAPVNVLFRSALDGLTIHGHRITPGTMIGACVSFVLRDPELYPPDPDQFNPARWRGRPVTPLETLPFGGGPHFCLGYHLAWMEVVQFSVALVREMAQRGLRPRLPSGAIPRPVHLPLTHPPAKTKIVFD